MATDNELLEEISGKLSDVNSELDLITLEQKDINSELDLLSIEFTEIDIFIDEQQLLNTEILAFMELKTEVDENIQYQLDTSIQMTSFGFIFIGMIVGVLLINVVSRFWRNV